MADWPSTLPQRFSLSDMQESMPDGRIKSDMDAGPPKKRLVTTSNVAPLSGSMLMTTAQWTTLETFFTVTVSQVMPFNFPQPGNEGNLIEVCFDGPPTRSPVAPGLWRVSLKMEKNP